MNDVLYAEAIGHPMPAIPLRVMAESSSVDRANRIIRGAVMIERGKIDPRDPRPWYVDDTTLRQVIQFGNAHPAGLKARWTHPHQGRDGLGDFLGKWTQLRLSPRGSAVLADLRLSEVAFRGGETSRGQWILDMARDDPDAFGVSIYPDLDDRAMAEGTAPDGLVPLRIVGLIAADLTDNPAATRGGLFGTGALSVAAATPTEISDALGVIGSTAYSTALAEYRDNAAMLRRDGVSVVDYVASCLLDHGVDTLPPNIRTTLQLEQQKLGEPRQPGDRMTW